jgi:hypothetical protein
VFLLLGTMQHYKRKQLNMSDFMYVASTEKAWNEFAVVQGLATEELIEGVTTLVYKPGITVDHLGAVMTDPGEWDNTVDPPEMITPPTYDTRFHINVRYMGEPIGKFVKAAGDRPPEDDDVLWVDSLTVETPLRIWLGGMNYYETTPPPEVNPVKSKAKTKVKHK